MTYDFRNDIKKLMDSADSTEVSLNQCATAIEMYLNLWHHMNSEEIAGNAKEIPAKPEDDACPKVDKDDTIVPLLFNSPASVEPVKHVATTEKPKTENLIDKVGRPSNKLKINNSTKVTKIIKHAEKTSEENDEITCTAKQTLAGAQLVDSDGIQRSYINESFRKKCNIYDGDTVVIKPVEGAYPYVVNVINNHKESNIRTFSPALVQKDNGHLVITHTVNGEDLFDVAGVHTYMVDPRSIASYNLEEGDVVTLTWYNNSFMDTARINWKYPTKDEEDSKKKDQSKPAIEPAKKSTHKSKPYEPKIDFDLHNQSVALVTADDALADNLAKVALAHNGILGIVSGENPKNIINHLSHYDIVIMTKNYINHEISGAIIKASQNKEITNKIALVNTKGQLTFEKALYRANEGFSFNDQTGINYPEN